MKGQRGVTLVELLVALALLGSIAVLSAQLVIQSAKLINVVARSSRNPDLVVAGQWIRRDLYETTSVVGSGLGWNEGPLVTVTQSGGWLAFAPVDGELIRSNAPPGMLPVDNRVVLRGVIGWRWRVVDFAAVEIELQTYINPEAHHQLTGAGFPKTERRTERLVLALRGRPGGVAW